jgi:hypothetical protein
MAAQAALDRAQSLYFKVEGALTKRVSDLSDGTFADFKFDIDHAAETYEWHAALLNTDLVTTPDPNIDDLSVLEVGHIKQLYNLLIDKCKSHQDVFALLKQVPAGPWRGRHAWIAVIGHFRQVTQGGLTAAQRNFNFATMANTDCTINMWTAKVKELGQVLRDVGGECNELRETTLLLEGLLPEFEVCKDHITLQSDRSWLYAKTTILNFAAAKKLTTLTKAGGGGNRHQTFNAVATTPRETGQASQQPCNNYSTSKWGCRYGTLCKYSHSAPGGKNHPLCKLNPGKIISVREIYEWQKKQHGGDHKPTAQPAATYPPAQPKPVCHFCASDQHAMCNCPVYEARQQRQQQPAQTFAASTQQPYPAYTFTGKALLEEPSLAQKCAKKCCSTLGCWLAIVLVFVATVVLSPDVGNVAAQRPFVVTALASAVLLASCRTFALPSGSCTEHTCSPATTFELKSQAVKTSRVKASSYTVDCDTTTAVDTSNFEWCSDPGTNRFVTNDVGDFVPGSIKQHATTVAVGGGNTSSPCYGDVLVESLPHNLTVLCRDVLLMPECKKKLMPASTFIKKGCSLTFSGLNKVSLTDPEGRPIFSGIEIEGIYFYQSRTISGRLKSQQQQASHHHGEGDAGEPPAGTRAPSPWHFSFFGLPTSGNIKASGLDFAKQLLEAHWAYGHLNFTKLRKLLGLKPGDNPDCLACTMATSRQEALKQDYVRSTRVNHRMHMDLGYTKNYEFTFQLYVDCYTRESYIDVLDTKGNQTTLEKWIDLKTHLEKVHWPHKFALLRTDGEPVYTTTAWGMHCKTEGIVHEFSSRHRQDQNGVVERAMQAIGVPFRCMMLQGNAPAKFIPDALRQANVIRNHSPTTANGGKTPRERARDMKLPMNKRLLMGPLFCLIFAHVYEIERAKHEPRGVACVYLGYDDTNNAFKVMEWDSGRIYYTADGTWHPSVFPFRANPNRDRRYLNVFDYLSPLHAEPIPLPPRSSSRIEQYLRSDNVNISDIPDVDMPPDGNYMLHSHETPKSWKAALASEDGDEWVKARLTEMNSFREHDVLELVPRSTATDVGAKIFHPKIVLKTKLNPPTPAEPMGSVEKFKYRLVIAAFTKMMTQGIDYAEKHANQVRWNSILVLLATAVIYDLDITLFDIRTFFLTGELDADCVVFMEQPEGWEPLDKPRKDFICRLKKSMYGLPQASHVAQLKLNAALTKSGKFRATTADDCVFVTTTPPSAPGYAATGTHVDDLVSIGDTPGLAKLEGELRAEFSITVKPAPTLIMAVEVDRRRAKKWMKLHQTAYTTALLTKHQMLDCTPTDTPMDAGTAKTLMTLPTNEPDPATVALYQALVGALMWLRTRPDMQFTINLASRFLQCATKAHYDLIRGRPLRYLKGTVDHGIVFMAPVGDPILTAHGDADLAGDLKTGRSTIGGLSQYGSCNGVGGTVSSSSKLERKIATSTGQAETYALVALTKEVVWLRHLLWDLGFPQSAPTPAYTDNDGVLSQATKAINHAAAKHYRLGQAYVRQLGKSKVIKVKGISTSDNAADIFTKALAAPLFLKHRLTIMGPQAPP